MNCMFDIHELILSTYPSSSSGFFEALYKFAGCLGAASFAWMVATPVAVFILIAIRSKAHESSRVAGGGGRGDFEALGEDVDTDISDLEHANLNGKNQTERMLVTPYSNLDTGNEMTRINASLSSPSLR